MTEIWKPVPDWENFYEVSDCGNVRSTDRWMPKSNNKGCYLKKGIVLKPGKNSTGYFTVNLKVGRKRRTYKVHILVALAFLTKEPHHECVRHLDGDYLNNSLSNLALGTLKENSEDTIRHKRSTRHFSDEEIFWIRQKFIVNKLTVNQIAETIDVSKHVIWNICHFRRYEHVE